VNPHCSPSFRRQLASHLAIHFYILQASSAIFLVMVCDVTDLRKERRTCLPRPHLIHALKVSRNNATQTTHLLLFHAPTHLLACLPSPLSYVVGWCLKAVLPPSCLRPCSKFTCLCTTDWFHQNLQT